MLTIPRISGRSSLTTVSEIRLSPSERRVSRWLLLAADPGLDLGDLQAGHQAAPPRRGRLPRRAWHGRAAWRPGRPPRGSGRGGPRSPRGARGPCSAATVAWTMLIGLEDPSDLLSTSWMPAHSSTARTGPPAMTPVPGLAGLSSTTPAAASPWIGCGMVVGDARHAEEVLLGLLDALGDRRGHLLGLAVADADLAVAVADDHEGGEAEATTALHDLGDAVDRDDALDVVALLGSAAPPPPRPSRRSPPAGPGAAGRPVRLGAGVLASDVPLLSACGQRCRRPSERQPVLAGAVGQRGDAAVVGVAAAVEDDRVDAGLLGARGDEGADLAGAGRSCRRPRRAGRPRASRRRPACGPRCRRRPAR